MRFSLGENGEGRRLRAGAGEGKFMRLETVETLLNKMHRGSKKGMTVTVNGIEVDKTKVMREPLLFSKETIVT